MKASVYWDVRGREIPAVAAIPAEGEYVNHQRGRGRRCVNRINSFVEEKAFVADFKKGELGYQERQGEPKVSNRFFQQGNAKKLNFIDNNNAQRFYLTFFVKPVLSGVGSRKLFEPTLYSYPLATNYSRTIFLSPLPPFPP
ncbi:hypothetical protein M408DRAFT_261411 [Serendipita vermifera MAFF 305830]|uniref:Uncharacterized protein n=1 Tax=Serendipita vermifera MAFF 305830 TaxID=933852 RepID=A0A0C3B408_SERVB|nr:hypothetical protein M408DRAFT_261411 [Serendipita vermifera MAFF 305830]